MGTLPSLATLLRFPRLSPRLALLLPPVLADSARTLASEFEYTPEGWRRDRQERGWADQSIVRVQEARWAGLVQRLEGAIVCEKVMAGDPALDAPFTEAYYGFKRRQGYSEGEIWRKREALETVLVPYRLDEDTALFRRAGFRTVEPFFQWFNFAAFVCIK